MDTDNTHDRIADGTHTHQTHDEIAAGVLVLPPAIAAIVTPLAAEDEEALEAGIASMFEDLRLADVEPDEDADEGGPTFALLAELNRLWAQPLAA
jgi:hypothetical protein